MPPQGPVPPFLQTGANSGDETNVKFVDYTLERIDCLGGDETAFHGLGEL